VEKYDSSCNFVKNWGTAGAGNNQFIQPSGIVYNTANGRIYVSDRQNYIRVFDTDGTYITRWQSWEVVSLGVDTAGNIYVTSELGGGRVYKYTADGALVGSRASPSPAGVAVADTGEIFVVDSSGVVHIYGSDWSHINDFGTHGGAAGQFNKPYGVEAFSGLIFVANKMNDSIEIFDQSGNYVSSFGESGRGPGKLYHPTDIVVISSTEILIVEKDNDRIQKFSE